MFDILNLFQKKRKEKKINNKYRIRMKYHNNYWLEAKIEAYDEILEYLENISNIEAIDKVNKYVNDLIETFNAGEIQYLTEILNIRKSPEFPICFLITENLLYEWLPEYFPFSGQWNAYSPFYDIQNGPKIFNNIEDVNEFIKKDRFKN